MTSARSLLLGVTMLLAAALATPGRAATYYVSSSAGSDSADGLTVGSPWRSLGKVGGMTFVAGDSILFRRGDAWEGFLHPLGSGAAGNPIVIGAYGSGPAPLINTAGTYPTAVLLLNQEYWVISDLEVTNLHPSNGTASRYGVYVISNDVGVLHDIVLRNLVVHDVNGNPASKTCGGIVFEVMGAASGWFDSLLIEGCEVYDVSPVGIASTSNQSVRTLTTNTNWAPSLRVVIRNNVIRRTVRNGMVIRVARGARIEHNVLQECAKDSSGNALFMFNCDSTIVQYNEAYLTRFNAGDEDAGGFDGDYRCKNTLIQYNYSHDNEYGGIVVVSDGGGNGTFNDGAVVRYNVLKDNLSHAIRVSGNVTNARFYNNTIYSGTAAGAIVAVWHKSWGGYCDNTQYYNNIFETRKLGSSIQLGGSTNTIFDHNLFHGTRLAGEPPDAHKLTADPLFAAPESAGTGFASVSGLRLLGSSPAINSGRTLPGHSPTDIVGAPVPAGDSVDLGAIEFQGGPDAVGESESGVERAFSLDQNYPNPFNGSTTIAFTLPSSGPAEYAVYDLMGRLVASQRLGRLDAGRHVASFDASALPSGIYFYALRFGALLQTRRCILLR